MIGKVLGTIIRAAAAPARVVETVFDAATGGNGDRRELRRSGFPLLSDAVDSIASVVEKADGR